MPVKDTPLDVKADISTRTIDRWIFEHELRQKRRRQLYRLVYYANMIGMAVMVILVPVHWSFKVLGEIGLLCIAFFVWALDNTKDMDYTLPLSPDEKILQEELERRENLNK